VIGASVSQALDASVLLAALGAAVIGRMERLPTTVFASVGLGIVSEAVFYRWDNDAARPVVITLIIAVALITQRTDRGNRLRSAAISTWQSTREIRPIPKELRREPAVIAVQSRWQHSCSPRSRRCRSSYPRTAFRRSRRWASTE